MFGESQHVSRVILLFFLAVCLIASSCARKKSDYLVVEESVFDTTSRIRLPYPEKLSDYGFFVGELHRLIPAERVVPYEVNAALFSDYAWKKRFIYFPPGTAANYHPTDVLEFPEGAVLIKNFYYPADFRKPDENIRILETRILKLENGKWIALPYIWNDAQTEAYLDISGRNIPVTWTHDDGMIRTLNYSVPNMNQCKGCHLRGDRVMPIGTTARQLNGPYKGHQENQLIYLASAGLLRNLPPLDEVPHLANYEDEHETLDVRARAWLEVNCAHCHRPDGPAKTSGLHLLASVTRPFELGIGKPPVAAGRGSGGLKYDIVPGKPEQSILYFRITSTDPGIMMPELGKQLVHQEGVALIREWIARMKP